MPRRSETYNLAVINPDLADQWHPTKNGDRTPKDVAPGSHDKAWWRCEKGHAWDAVVSSRNRGSGCPDCPRYVSEDKCLQTVNPTLAAQWHPTRNGNRTPKNVKPNSTYRARWRCEKDHEWDAAVHSRSNGHGCPDCANAARRSGK